MLEQQQQTDLANEGLGKVVVTKVISVDRHSLWEYLENNPGWHPSCARVEMNGHLNILYLKNGQKIVESRRAIPETYEFRYHFLESPFPLRDYRVLFRIHHRDDHSCFVEWRSTFKPNGLSLKEAQSFVSRIYHEGLEFLAARVWDKLTVH